MKHSTLGNGLLSPLGRWLRWLLVAALVAGLVVGCQGSPPEVTTAPPATPVSLVGTGASFPLIFYTKLFSEYSRLHPTVQINYQDTGSAAGIQQMVAATVDFAGSDVAMTDEEMAQATQDIVLVPMTAGSVAVAYNLPDLEGELRLSRAALVGIFSGEITTWSDGAIAAANPAATLPDLPILVVHRSDGSGSTAAFTAHLSAISPQWEAEVGTGLNVSWPVGVGIKSTAGVSAQIMQEAGAIGYVEYSYAKRLNMATAALENQGGNFIPPSPDSVRAALSEAAVPDDLRIFVPDPSTPAAYPVVTYSWLLLYETYDDPAKAAALKDVVRWGLTEGQSFSAELGYTPLSPAVVAGAIAALDRVQS